MIESNLQLLLKIALKLGKEMDYKVLFELYGYISNTNTEFSKVNKASLCTT